MTLERLILLGGILHFGILIASALVPQVLDWKTSLARLEPLARQLVWVHGAFIVLIILGFGTLSLGMSAELAAGTPLARAVCLLIALFWAIRLAVQFFYFDASAYLKTRFLKVGYHGLTVVFAFHTLVYSFAAIFP